MEVLLSPALSCGTGEGLWAELGTGIDSLLLEWRSPPPISPSRKTEFGAILKFMIHKNKLNCDGMESQSKVEEGITVYFTYIVKGFMRIQ